MQTDEPLLSALYEGPLEDPPFRTFLDALRERTKSATANWVVRAPGDPGLGLILTRGLRRYEAAYRERFFARDPFVNLPEGEVVALSDLLPEPELRATDFFRHFLEPAGVSHILGVDLRADNLDARLRVSRTREGAPFGASERALLAALVPHARRALRIYGRIVRAEGERDAYAGTVDQLALGAILLDDAGAVLSRNEASRGLAARGEGVDVRERLLVAPVAEDTRALRTAVERSLAARARGAPALVEALKLRSRAGASFGVLLRALPAEAHVAGRPAPALALFHGDPSRRDAISPDALRALFGLTPAEAALAARLATGLTLEEAAEELGIARNTARAQLRAVFDKAGVSRQAELVRAVLRSVAALA